MPVDDDIYIMRVFARQAQAPTPQAVADHLRARGFNVRVEPDSSDNWRRIRLFSADGRSPLDLERQSLHGDAPLSDRLRALMDATATARDRRGRQGVLDFLAQTVQVFELIVPPDFDWHAGRHLVTTELLNYLEKETDGLIEADGDGYYRQNRVLLRL
jgi:hypothetical protein